MITAVANSISYSIEYDQNTVDTVTDMPASSEQATVNTDDFTITLSSSTPKRSGYIFKGWCTSNVGDNVTCPNSTYRPNTNFPVDYTTNTTTLYATWVDATLWNVVVDEWERGGSRMQTDDKDPDTGIKAPITTANSGVFKYNSEAFNGDTDATKPDGTKYDIYYFRGILDNTVGTYGSDGDGEAWPNYVLLDLNNNGTKDTTDTCWRIVRTTASGGTKMIYSGLYGATTAGSCVNATDNAQTSKSAFNSASKISNQSIISVGYTFNNTYRSTTTDTPYGELFGTNESYSGNTTDSTIKDYIENTWFNSTSGIGAYESMLEPNAGFCNDRSLYDGSYMLVGDNDNIIKPTGGYGTTTQYNFGAYYRSGFTPYYVAHYTLTCLRNKADVYTINMTIGDTVEMYGGNGQLKYPVALLTVDELLFASSSKKAYLNSGGNFWLLSPLQRQASNSFSHGLISSSNGGILNNNVVNSHGVRPVISFIHSTIISSGTGTAVDPFIISPPPSE